jgi:N-acetyl-anhydromuramyl-L-alanine amidase AmpD
MEDATMTYRVEDVSASTLPVLYAPRPKPPIGFLLHTTDGKDSLAWLQGGSARAGKPASADFLITKLGKIIRVVPRGTHSYHAGVCRWRGRIETGNLVSTLLVGIEVENADSQGEEPNEEQHRAVAALLLVGASKYAWSPLRGFGHYGLAHPMGRRSDPHAWDWGYLAWLMAHAKDSLRLIGDAAF